MEIVEQFSRCCRQKRGLALSRGLALLWVCGYERVSHPYRVVQAEEDVAGGGSGGVLQVGPSRGEPSPSSGEVRSLSSVTSSKLTNSGSELMSLFGSSAMGVPSTPGRLIVTLCPQTSGSC